MTQKGIFAIGMITALVLTAIVAVKPAEAENNEDLTRAYDDIDVEVNVEPVIQTAIVVNAGDGNSDTAIVENSGEGNTNIAIAQSRQLADIAKSDGLSDDETNSIDIPSVVTP